MLTDTQIHRLKELEEKEGDFTEDERKEWIELHEDQENEAINPITEEQKLQPLKDERLKLEMERKRLELELDIKAEKIRIEKAKKELDGMVYCDDCRKWVYPDHFE